MFPKELDRRSTTERAPMEIELKEIRDFIAQHPPFDVLPADIIDALPGKLRVRYQRRGDPFPPTGNDAAFLYIVRSGAIELRDNRGHLIDKLGEGDTYNNTCQDDNPQVEMTGVASEDSLLYLLPCEQFLQLLKVSAVFETHFSKSSQERLKRAANNIQSNSAGTASALATEVGDLITRDAVTIEVGESIQAAAKVMADKQVSSLMIMSNGQLAGLLTDSDLRKRCLAEGLPADTPVDNIMTRDIRSVTHTTLASDALLMMTELRLHHLPVMENGKLSGMISISDLIRLQSNNPAFISVAVRKAQSLSELQKLSGRLPELQIQLARTGVSAQHICTAITSISDSITTRLIELAESELGAPPVPYAWLAGGSQGRREQTSHTDQDNALLIADTLADADRDYFAALSTFVCDGLDACGYTYCPGEAMARNPRWRQPLHVWNQYFSDWIEKPEPKALMLASIFFDLRPVYGDTSLFESLQSETLDRCSDNRIFIAYLVSNALTHRPPLGFFRNLVLIHDGEHKDTLDIKHRGIVPIVDIARIYALAEGIPAVNTLDRLRLACEHGTLSKDMYTSLQDAFELLSSLRIRHQAEQITRGRESDNYLSLDKLSRLERSHLKDAFGIIKSLQETLANRHQSGRFS